MAFDQSTKNKLQKFVSDARLLLSNEFIRQMQNEYGLDPNTGLVSDLSKLKHLDDARRQTASLIRDTINHYAASSPTGGSFEAMNRIVREQAFTILNRLCTLRMAEARGILIESIGNGYNSKGFQLYIRLAGTALGEKGDAYKCFIYSLFDEFANDLPVFFDRYSPMGRLFPRETVLLELLSLINDPEIIDLWTEDETIGWIYQYFNSIEERKQMRSESRAPRNSRELAVRNQFFTPRYVVEYLTDNTLGRIWYEMTKGETTLLDKCNYLVTRPNEIFLKEGEEVHERNESTETISQEDLLNQSIYIPYRQMKDPREIKLLDPACGSMHFGLYAFDLFMEIYEEAWDIEEQKGEFSLKRETGILPLTATYKDKESFLRDIPRLIIENNIHGIDIDPRAVQIAGLSLWLRAQRSWKEQNVKMTDRPKIRKSNIVCAEPMPGEKDMLNEFLSTLKPRVMAQVVENIFEQMELAGEAGVLLKIDEEIQDAIDEAREEFNKELLRRRSNEQLELFVEEVKPKQISLFDFTDLPDKTQFWENAEQKILESLKKYAESLDSGSSMRRLFSEDASKGFAFIEISNKTFDVIVMNPPFGDASKKLEKYLDSKYNNWNKNILCTFIIRMKELSENGLIGAIFDRTAAIKSSYDNFRISHLDEYIITVADTGWDVLDANVETTVHVFSSNKNDFPASFFDVQNIAPPLKQEILYEKINNFKRGHISEDVYLVNPSILVKLPNAIVGYYFDDFLLWMFANLKNLGQVDLRARQGHDFVSKEHFRLFWEIKDLNGGIYSPVYNGSEFSMFSIPLRDVSVYGVNGDLIKPNKSVTLRNLKFQSHSGVGYGKRGEILDAHILPEGFVFTNEGQAITKISEANSFLLLSFLNSSLAQYTVNQYCGQHKNCGYINLLPWPKIDTEKQISIIENVKKIIDIKRKWLDYDETTKDFKPFRLINNNTSIERFSNELKELYDMDCVELNQRIKDNDNAFLNSTGINSKQKEDINVYINQKRPNDYPWPDFERDKGTGDFEEFITKGVISMLIGCSFGRWFIPNQIEDFNLTLPSDFSNFNKTDILSSDEGIGNQMFSRVRELMKVIWGNYDEKIESEICDKLGLKSLAEYFNNLNLFFADHLRRYTKSRRQAPVYWPLSTESGKFTIWLCYSNLTDQTLYSCVNDIIDPKIKQITDYSSILLSKTNRSSQDEKELEGYQNLELELKNFRDEILRIARFWKPNFHDGVQIIAAPLWKLIQYKPWQKALKETWEMLEEGKYDWSHLAFNIWPSRVREKCKSDKSLAMIHGLDNLYVERTIKTK
nr:BREX-1 system adenine-specific DNA-methyltransferase PglX [Neobacillus sp. Marseille-Q6967]